MPGEAFMVNDTPTVMPLSSFVEPFSEKLLLLCAKVFEMLPTSDLLFAA